MASSWLKGLRTRGSELAGKLPAIGSDKCVTAYEQTDPAAGQIAGVGDKLLRRPPLLITHPLPGSRAHQTVRQVHAVNSGFIKESSHFSS